MVQMKLIIFVILLIFISGCYGSVLPEKELGVCQKALQCYYEKKIMNDCSFEIGDVLGISETEEDYYIISFKISGYNCKDKDVNEDYCVNIRINNKEKCFITSSLVECEEAEVLERFRVKPE